jgi:hypothetical protein
MRILPRLQVVSDAYPGLRHTVIAMDFYLHSLLLTRSAAGFLRAFRGAISFQTADVV